MAAQLALHCRTAAEMGVASEETWRAAAARMPGTKLWLPKPGSQQQAAGSLAFLRRAYAEHLIRAQPPQHAAPAPLPPFWGPLEQCAVQEVSSMLKCHCTGSVIRWPNAAAETHIFWSC